jgi:hypothetical protein
VNSTIEYVTNWCQKRDYGWNKTLQLVVRYFNELRNMCAGQEGLEKSITAVNVGQGELEFGFLNQKGRGQTGR